eukprot:GILK01004405.1.p1 GENE.GILK01004405.1~~GILK01004405.1.p1  ORF type:complete len:569 (+),score=138.96 GILK01004405.1:39-1709(+)
MASGAGYRYTTPTNTPGHASNRGTTPPPSYLPPFPSHLQPSYPSHASSFRGLPHGVPIVASALRGVTPPPHLPPFIRSAPVNVSAPSPHSSASGAVPIKATPLAGPEEKFIREQELRQEQESLELIKSQKKVLDQLRADNEKKDGIIVGLKNQVADLSRYKEEFSGLYTQLQMLEQKVRSRDADQIKREGEMSARLQHYESEESKYKAMLHQLQSLLRDKTEHTRELDAQLAAQRDVTERVETLKTKFEGELRAVTETAQQTGEMYRHLHEEFTRVSEEKVSMESEYRNLQNKYELRVRDGDEKQARIIKLETERSDLDSEVLSLKSMVDEMRRESENQRYTVSMLEESYQLLSKAKTENEMTIRTLTEEVNHYKEQYVQAKHQLGTELERAKAALQRMEGDSQRNQAHIHHRIESLQAELREKEHQHMQALQEIEENKTYIQRVAEYNANASDRIGELERELKMVNQERQMLAETLRHYESAQESSAQDRKDYLARRSDLLRKRAQAESELREALNTVTTNLKYGSIVAANGTTVSGNATAANPVSSLSSVFEKL